MTKIFNGRTLIAVVLAGVIGTVLNAVAVAIVVSPDRLSLALVPGRYAVAILLCLLLPLLANRLQGPWLLIVGTLWLTIAASLIAKLVFAAGAPWHLVLGFNLVYGIAAAVTYRIIANRRPRRRQ